MPMATIPIGADITLETLEATPDGCSATIDRPTG